MPANFETTVIDRGDSTITYDAALPLRSTDQRLADELVRHLATIGEEQEFHRDALAELQQEAITTAAQLKAVNARLAVQS